MKSFKGFDCRTMYFKDIFSSNKLCHCAKTLWAKILGNKSIRSIKKAVYWATFHEIVGEILLKPSVTQGLELSSS